MTTRSLPLAAVLVAATAGSAAANVVAYDGGASLPRDESGRRLEGRFGMLLGGSDVGDADGFSLGFSTGLGYRINDVTLRGTFDYYRVGDGGDETMDRSGRAARIGGALRYALAGTQAHDRRDGNVGVELWTELGLGVEHVMWRPGGVLDRASGSLALGFEVDGQGERRANGRRRHIGYFMAFRTLLAQGPEMNGPAVCGGPCTRATKPSRVDASMFFELGLHWGR